MTPVPTKTRVTTAKLCCDVDTGSLALNVVGTLEGAQLFFNGIVLPRKPGDLEGILRGIFDGVVGLGSMSVDSASLVYRAGDTFETFGNELWCEAARTSGGMVGKVYLTNSSRLVGYIFSRVRGYSPTMIGYAGSVKGSRRNKAFNDDSVIVLGASYCYGGAEKHVYVAAVADGVSSLEAGFKASSIAVKSFATKVVTSAYVNQSVDPSDIDESYRSTAEEVVRANQHHGRRSATTFTAAVYPVSGMLRIVHVGDTRAYLFYKGELLQLTEDHKIPGTHVITKALGNDVHEPQVFNTYFWPGAILVLASDGAYEIVGAHEMKHLLERLVNPAQVVGELIKMVVERAGGDDASVGIVKRLM